VDQLIGPTKEWDICKLKTVFSSDIVSIISGILIPKCGAQDQLTWHEVSMEHFSVRDAYSHCTDSVYGVRKKDCKWILGLVVSERIRAWLWKVRWNGISTKAFLFRRNLATDMRCPRWGISAEDIQHLLTDCY